MDTKKFFEDLNPAIETEINKNIELAKAIEFNMALQGITSQTLADSLGIPCDKLEKILSGVYMLDKSVLRLIYMKLNATECVACGGEGELDLTKCCGAEPWSNGDASTKDYGICPDCKDHAEYGVECEYCDGIGYYFEKLKEDTITTRRSSLLGSIVHAKSHKVTWPPT